RMLRELAAVVETLTAATPLLLVLEDLHWSDDATLDLVALLARGRTPARLLVLGTSRPVAGLVAGHPLRTILHDLQRHGHSIELPLPPLDRAAVAAYLTARLAGPVWPAPLAPWLLRQTEGHPLFLVTLVETLLARGVLVAQAEGWTLWGPLDTATVGIPEGLRPLIEAQLAQVAPAAYEVLAAASVAGGPFTPAAVAAGLTMAIEPV